MPESLVRPSPSPRPVSHQPRSAPVPVTVGTALAADRPVAAEVGGPQQERARAGLVDRDHVEQLDDEVVGPVVLGVRRPQVDVVDLQLAPPGRHDGRRGPGRPARRSAVKPAAPAVLGPPASTASANAVVAARSRSRSSAASASASSSDVGVALLVGLVHRHRLAPRDTVERRRPWPQPFRARWATTWARVHPGQQRRRGELVGGERVDGAVEGGRGRGPAPVRSPAAVPSVVHGPISTADGPTQTEAQSSSPVIGRNTDCIR